MDVKNTNAFDFNNRLEVSGRALGQPVYTHTVHTPAKDIRYFRFILASKRASGIEDQMEVSIKEELMLQVDFNQPLHLIGEIRTVNIGSQLKLYVFATAIMPYSADYDINHFEATVYTCRAPRYRLTPRGKRITDLTLACIRHYKNRSDYFPVIAWGQQAEATRQLKVGQKLYLYARMQSREYVKVINETPTKKTAFEISLTAFKVLD